MEIKIRLRLVTAISLIVVLVYGALTFYTYNRLNIVTKEIACVDEIFEKLFKLKMLTNDYLLHRSNRAEQQWWHIFQDINNLFNSKIHALPTLSQLTAFNPELSQIGNDFRALMAINLEGNPDPEDQDAKKKFRNRLVTQMLLNLEEITTKIFQLNAEVTKAAFTWQRLDTFLNLSSLFIMFAIILANSLVLARTVIGPVSRLYQGAEIIGRGNLDYKVGVDSKDEIGQLSRAFDAMTGSLKNLTVSRDELEQRIKARTADLQSANEALQQSEENLRFLTSQVLAAQENERKRISYELHDGLGQSLMVLKLQLRATQKMMPPAGKEREEFESALSYVNGIVESVRLISKALSPSVLRDLGLPIGLKQLFEETCQLQGIEYLLDLDDIDALFPLEHQLIIYRILQEILNNIIKHAQATRIELGIKRLDGKVRFSVADNGIGFDFDQIMACSLKDRGMGLAYMQEQARMLGGDVRVRSHKGGGTKIDLTIPISAGA